MISIQSPTLTNDPWVPWARPWYQGSPWFRSHGATSHWRISEARPAGNLRQRWAEQTYVMRRR